MVIERWKARVNNFFIKDNSFFTIFYINLRKLIIRLDIIPEFKRLTEKKDYSRAAGLAVNILCYSDNTGRCRKVTFGRWHGSCLQPKKRTTFVYRPF